MYSIFQNDLKKKLNDIQEREKQSKKELGEVRKENSRIQKTTLSSPSKSDESQLDVMRNELKGEKEKVQNLTVWKSQLSEKNKELKEENERYGLIV